MKQLLNDVLKRPTLKGLKKLADETSDKYYAYPCRSTNRADHNRIALKVFTKQELALMIKIMNKLDIDTTSRYFKEFKATNTIHAITRQTESAFKAVREAKKNAKIAANKEVAITKAFVEAADDYKANGTYKVEHGTFFNNIAKSINWKKLEVKFSVNTMVKQTMKVVHPTLGTTTGVEMSAPFTNYLMRYNPETGKVATHMTYD